MKRNVTILEYDELPDEEKSNWGVYPNEYAHFLKVEFEGKPTVYYSDDMQPEDAKFDRDLSWIKDLLIDAYQAGKESDSVIPGKRLRQICTPVTPAGGSR